MKIYVLTSRYGTQMYEGAEVCRILRRQVIDYIVNADAFAGILVDINGNKVGRWWFE